MFMKAFFLFCCMLLACASSAVAVTAQNEIAEAPSQAQEAGMTVSHIVFDRIEGGTLYSKDGRSISLSSDTRVVDRRSPRARTSTAELVFKGGRLLSVTIR